MEKNGQHLPEFNERALNTYPKIQQIPHRVNIKRFTLRLIIANFRKAKTEKSAREKCTGVTMVTPKCTLRRKPPRLWDCRGAAKSLATDF